MCRSRRVCLPVVLGVTIAAAFHLAAIAQPYTERVEVTVANVDVVVTDADGNPVRGLTQDDFELFESGKKQAITNFTAIDVERATAPVPTVRGEAGPVTPAVTAAMAPRLFIFFIDIAEIEPSRRIRFFEAVRAFLASARRPEDLVSVLVWNQRVRVVLEPTSDRRSIDAVIAGLATPFGSKEREIADRIAATQIEQAQRDAAISAALGVAPLTDVAAEVQFQEFLKSENRCATIRRKLSELRNLLASFSRVEMQKLLVFGGDDFSLQPYRDCLNRPYFDRLADTANAYGITIHAVHPPGNRDAVIGPEAGGFLPSTRAQSPMAQSYERTFDEAGGLLAVAKRTGGLSAIGPQQSAKLFERAAREFDVYYSLGYRVTSPGDDKARRISVTTKNRSHRVRARESVVHLSEASRIRDLVTTNLYLPASGDTKGPAFSVRVGKGRRDGRFVILPVDVLFDARALALLPSTKGKSKGAVSFFVTSGRELGDASDVTELKKEFEVPTPVADAPSNVLYSFAVRVRPDTRRLSIALRDDVSGDVGTRVVGLDGNGTP